MSGRASRMSGGAPAIIPVSCGAAQLGVFIQTERENSRLEGPEPGTIVQVSGYCGRNAHWDHEPVL